MGHTTTDYRSGNGLIQFGLWDGATPPALEDLYDVGNGVAFKTEPKVTKKSHYAHRGGLATKDKSVTVKREVTLTVQLDEWNDENLKTYFQGVLALRQIKPLEGENEEYLVRFTETLISGEERVHEWSRVAFSAASAIELIQDGEGDTDWSPLELSGEVLSNDPVITFDSRTHGIFGLIYPKPTT